MTQKARKYRYFNIWKVNITPKIARRYREEHYIFIKRKIHQEDIAILKIFVPNAKTF